MTRRLTGLATLLTLTTLAACASANESVRDETGAITQTNDTASVFEMAVGDCYDDPGADAEEVETLPAVPCDQEHDFEVYASQSMDDAEYPGEEAAVMQAEDVCTTEFETYVGLTYDESELELTYLYPTTESWAQQDDREITCLAIDPAGPTDGTLEGSQR